MTNESEITPAEIISFWFPDGSNPEAKTHIDLWGWRMRGGANDEIMERYSVATELAAQGEFDQWADDVIGRLALIILLDQFSRTVWAGTPKAFEQDPKALDLCLEGLDNGHFDSLDNVWFKTVFKLPMEHCECTDHLANLNRVVEIADEILKEAPEHLKGVYEFAAGQPRKHRAVIARFRRHSHRNEVLGRQSTKEEMEYLATGDFPHEVELKL